MAQDMMRGALFMVCFKKMLKSVLFIIIGFCMMNYAISVLGYSDNVHTSKVFETFYTLPDDSLDVVWIGCSSVQEEVNPAIVYKESGIALYNLSTGNLPFMATKNLIHEVEKTQSPKLYLVDIRWLAVETNTEWYIRRVTDNMKFSVNRLNAINYMVNGIKKYYPYQSFNMGALYFPFLINHNRWEEINAEDFGCDNNIFYGYFIPEGSAEFDKTDIVSRFKTEEIPISEMNEMFLNDFFDYCDSSKLNIVFTNTPNCAEAEFFGKYNYIERKIKERGYEYWDFNDEIDEIGIDYSNDFTDQYHLTMEGGEKFSRYVAQKMAQKYGLEGHTGDENYNNYEELVQLYEKQSQIFALKHTNVFEEYLNELEQLSLNDYAYIISVKDIQGYFLSEDIMNQLKKLGFKDVDILLEHTYHSFIGIAGLKNSNVELYGGDEYIQYSDKINGREILVTSSTLNTGNNSCIQIGLTNYSINQRGLNIVVTDKQTGDIVDSVCFDTHVPEFTCYR